MNRQWILNQRPAGLPSVNDFKWVQSPIPEPKDGEVLVRTVYLSVDPYTRGRMRNVRSYVPPLEVGQVIEGGIAGRVVKSKSPVFKEGDLVMGRLGWQDYAVAQPDQLSKCDPDPTLLSASLGVLGMTGLTAYFALLDIGRPQAGQTVLISGAAGAVGSVAGQIAKIKGCRTVGIAGSDDKVKFLIQECGFDAAINYKTCGNIRKAIKIACPDGVDVYFDNVGGEISDAAITVINMKARIIICGQIAIANREKPELGPRNLLYLLINRARMEGFLVHDYRDRFAEGLKDLKTWTLSGRIKARETVVPGLEKAPEAFIGLFTGQNTGKMLVKVAD